MPPPGVVHVATSDAAGVALDEWHDKLDQQRDGEQARRDEAQQHEARALAEKLARLRRLPTKAAATAKELTASGFEPDNMWERDPVLRLVPRSPLRAWRLGSWSETSSNMVMDSDLGTSTLHSELFLLEDGRLAQGGRDDVPINAWLEYGSKRVRLGHTYAVTDWLESDVKPSGRMASKPLVRLKGPARLDG